MVHIEKPKHKDNSLVKSLIGITQAFIQIGYYKTRTAISGVAQFTILNGICPFAIKLDGYDYHFIQALTLVVQKLKASGFMPDLVQRFESGKETPDDAEILESMAHGLRGDLMVIDEKTMDMSSDL